MKQVSSLSVDHGHDNHDDHLDHLHHLDYDDYLEDDDHLDHDELMIKFVRKLEVVHKEVLGCLISYNLKLACLRKLEVI